MQLLEVKKRVLNRRCSVISTPIPLFSRLLVTCRCSRWLRCCWLLLFVLGSIFRLSAVRLARFWSFLCRFGVNHCTFKAFEIDWPFSFSVVTPCPHQYLLIDWHPCLDVFCRTDDWRCLFFCQENCNKYIATRHFFSFSFSFRPI